MGIDYTKRPKPDPQPQHAGQGGPVSLSKVTLTKAAPTVSLTKQGSATGVLRVNLNWNARPAGQGGGLFKRMLSGAIDLDLGCLYEFVDGSKGVVQALGNAFSAQPYGAREAVIWLDGDDRSGTNSAGENLYINLAYANQIRRVMVFALIYEGVPNWAAADGVVTLYPAAGPQVEVRLDDSRDGARICGIAMIESNGGDLSVRREVTYINGSQRDLDRAYGWGMRWAAGSK
ncbi:tellurite resistance protein TerA [Micromonospora pattaloongensis]|uniref:Tellurite resistance protein TerA n=1 Tax=Micromonospora pattaloongensis TaxID=405436 RepID=A0A1H3JNC0_9ACTN|nr:tellurium resistance protein [Micromonospora pattaloongensis]SDY41099.1 tellurite resistance protein TerA [Micromonospora pattaloongensis]